MVTQKSLTIYVEGAAKGTLAAQARQMFTKFLKDQCLKQVRPRVTFCGPRNEAYNQFCQAKSRGDECLLLVDSEELADPKLGPWQQSRIVKVDKWRKPRNATDEDLHFMASTMETWLVASDVELAAFFGTGFKPAKLPQAKDLETVPKDDINSGLRDATQGSSKGEYGKGPHSFNALAKMDPVKVLRRCPFWAKRFCDELKVRGMK